MAYRRLLLAFILALKIAAVHATPATLVPLSNAGSTTSIILVGGLEKNYHFFKEWESLLKNSGVAVYGFNDNFRTMSLQDSSWHLAVNLSLMADQDRKNLIIIAHSLGGMVAKHALHRMEQQDILSRFDKVELHAMGTPWGGSYLANLMPYLPFNKPVLRKAGYSMVTDIGSESLFMTQLSAPLPPNVRFYVYECTKDTVAEPKTELTKARYKVISDSASSKTLVYGGDHHYYSRPFLDFFDY